jgi:hypothetical protein
MAVNIDSITFRDVTPCSLVQVPEECTTSTLLPASFLFAIPFDRENGRYKFLGNVCKHT